jgi:hypothetical protein
MSLIVELLWLWPIISWCMCIYIVLASREGLRWFDWRQNPYLISFAASGVVVWALGISSPTSISVATSAACYSFYAVLVTTLHWRFRQWRIIIPVNLPLALLLLWTLKLEL